MRLSEIIKVAHGGRESIAKNHAVVKSADYAAALQELAIVRKRSDETEAGAMRRLACDDRDAGALYQAQVIAADAEQHMRTAGRPHLAKATDIALDALVEKKRRADETPEAALRRLIDEDPDVQRVFSLGLG